MGYGWLNVGSFFLGLLAWGLPAVIWIRGSRIRKEAVKWGTVGSAAACAVSLWLQIVYNHHLARIGDCESC